MENGAELVSDGSISATTAAALIHQVQPDPHAVKIQIEDIPETDQLMTYNHIAVMHPAEAHPAPPACFPGQVVPEISGTTAAIAPATVNGATPSAPPAPPESHHVLQPQAQQQQQPPPPAPPSPPKRMSTVTVSPRPQSPVEAQEVTQPFIPGNSSVRDVEAYKKCVDVLTVIIKEILPKNSAIQSNPKIDAEINQMAIDSLITLRFYSLQDDRLREQTASRKE